VIIMSLYEDVFNMPEKPKRKSGINSRVKGSKNENALCKKFLFPWTGERFAKTPASGGLKWASAFASGDVVNLDRGKEFEFCIETKHYAKLGLKSYNLHKNSIIYKFWRQAKRDADIIKKHTLLAVRQNGMKSGTWYIFFAENVKEKLGIKPIFEGEVDEVKIYGFGSEEILNIDYEALINKLT